MKEKSRILLVQSTQQIIFWNMKKTFAREFNKPNIRKRKRKDQSQRRDRKIIFKNRKKS